MENHSIFDESNRLARDIAGSNWFSFKSVGDQIGGIVKDIFEMPERDGMQAQRCFTVVSEGGEFVNVGLRRTNYILSRTDMLQIGDELGVWFQKEVPAKVSGHNPAKSMGIFTRLVGPRTGQAARDVKPVEMTKEEPLEAGEEF